MVGSKRQKDYSTVGLEYIGRLSMPKFTERVNGHNASLAEVLGLPEDQIEENALLTKVTIGPDLSVGGETRIRIYGMYHGKKIQKPFNYERILN